MAFEEVDRLLARARELDERVGEVLFGHVRELRGLVADRQAHEPLAQLLLRDAVLLEQVGPLARIRELDLEARARVGVAVEDLAHGLRVERGIQREHLHVALETRQHLGRLVGERVHLLLAPVEAHRVAGREEAEQPQDRDGEDRREDGARTVAAGALRPARARAARAATRGSRTPATASSSAPTARFPPTHSGSMPAPNAPTIRFKNPKTSATRPSAPSRAGARLMLTTSLASAIAPTPRRPS